MKLQYDATFSSSAGNAVLINNILFDIGISRKDKHFLKLLKQAHAIFISHKHDDHLNIGTLKWIARFYPLIPIYVNQDTYDFIKTKIKDVSYQIKVVKDKDIIKVDNTMIVQIFKTKHEEDVQTMGYLVTMSDFTQYVFATDFWDFKDLPQGKYDYIFVEANHDEQYAWLLRQLADLQGRTIAPWLFHSSDRHTTKQDAFNYYLTHRMSKDSVFVPLHKSSRFYEITDMKQSLKDILNGKGLED